MGGRLHRPSKHIRIAVAVSAILLAVLVPVCAWYTMTKRLSLTESMEVDMPPTIYIKDDKLQEITSFNLDGMTIGEEYNKVFCVSPAVIGSVNSFFLGVIYSENLGMDINIYPVYAVTDTEPTGDTLYENCDIGNAAYYFQYRKVKQDASDNIADRYEFNETYGNWENKLKPIGKLNYGVYKAYNGNEFSEPEATAPSEFIDKLNDTGRYRFFILNITWNENYQGEASAKEADIVYIVAKGTMKLSS